MSSIQDYLAQQKQFQDDQRAQQLRAQAFEQARQKGVAEARAQAASVNEIMKTKTRSTVAGLQILAVVSAVILLFTYNTIFAHQKRLFWMFTLIMVVMLVYKFVEVVKQDGGLAIGHLSR